ncbi:MAG: aspartyl protease family protein [Candidatus Marinimicrobia bacterium]|nr:aspartyl protease family protein [Candidatus Neomarinimicrobiota bacterium]
MRSIRRKILLLILISVTLLQAGVFHVPFKTVSNLIIVQAKVNGFSENFIFDTGAKTLIINRQYIEAYEKGSEKKYELRGIGSKVLKVEDVNVSAFEFADIQKKDFKAIVLEMSLIQEVVGQPVYGLIGYEIFKGYDVLIDYQESFLTFIPYDEFMFYWNNNIINQKFTLLDFFLSDHLPVIKALAGDKRITLGIDTGAARTLIDLKTIDKISYEIDDVKKQQLVGIDNQNLMITSGVITRLKIGDLNFNKMEILIQDISHINDFISTRVDGLIGYNILKNYRTLISYSNKKIVLVE